MKSGLLLNPDILTKLFLSKLFDGRLKRLLLTKFLKDTLFNMPVNVVGVGVHLQLRSL